MRAAAAAAKLERTNRPFLPRTKVPKVKKEVILPVPKPAIVKFTPKMFVPNKPEEFNKPVLFDEVGENVLKVIKGLSDEECNVFVWRCLGYQYDATLGNFTNENVMNRWKVLYPQPPDLIGTHGSNDSNVDKPVLKAAKALYRTVPPHYRDALTEMPGFEPIKMEDVTFNLVRRVQVSQLFITPTDFTAAHRSMYSQTSFFSSFFPTQMATWLIHFAANLIDKSPLQIEQEWAAERNATNALERAYKKTIMTYYKESKGFRITPPTEEEKNRPNRASRPLRRGNKLHRRDKDGL